MSLTACYGCGRDYTATGLFQTHCPDCKRTEAQTAQLAAIASHQASVVADAQTRIATSEENKNKALAEAAARQAEAAEREAVARARAATAATVGQLSDAGLERVHQYHLQEEDRANIQNVFDELGNCLALVEQDGRDTQHFREAAFVGEVSGVRQATGNPYAYRWHNLSAGIGKLLDLRTEVGRVRTWNAAQSREDVLRTIDVAVERARSAQRVAAYRCVRSQRESRARKAKTGGFVGGGLLLLGGIAVGLGAPPALVGGLGILVFMMFGLAMMSSGETLLSHAEMIEMASDESLEDLPPEHDAKAYGIAIGAAAAGVLAMIVGIKVNSATLGAVPRLTLRGQYAQGDTSLTIEPGWMTVGSSRLPLQDMDVDSEQGSVRGAVLKAGVFFDDACNLSVSRGLQSLTVTVEQNSHRSCSVFAGEWQPVM